ncbi:hypothetical protein MUY14_43390 [Amycolatopsis sp. FBCC-B4732]|uniref:hypothetical protein n=1 Tax=Amycolatopsis sp. FBCC-B4732 TaxID=3079339 RepID=UPI001FF661FD|nr:hypothetical protein [Amycolatopsis sp. FBCC-B4732]UOX88450.1 hypothetical protein MUY14_43390 [Amycolatopsis sp. FBCC-B4732]
MITIPSARTDSGVVEVRVSGALGPVAYPQLRESLRAARAYAAASSARALTIALSAVTYCDEGLPQELRELALTCTRDKIQLRIDIPPALLP